MGFTHYHCPWVIIYGIGDSFCLGMVGGVICYGVKGFRGSPTGGRRIGAISAIKAHAPVFGGSIGAFGGLFTVFECAVKGIRQKEDSYNAIIAGSLTGGAVASRQGVKMARNPAVVCACLMAINEGVKKCYGR